MKTLLIIATILLAIYVTANADAVSKQDMNMMAASTKAVDIYKERGIVGLFDEINQCYTRLKSEDKLSQKAVEFCIAMDMSAVFLDYSLASTMGFPRDQRFIDEVAFSRIHSMLAVFGVSKGIKDTQKYLGSRNERVQQLTYRAMTENATSSTISQRSSEVVQQHASRKTIESPGEKVDDRWEGECSPVNGEQLCSVMFDSPEFTVFILPMKNYVAVNPGRLHSRISAAQISIDGNKYFSASTTAHSPSSIPLCVFDATSASQILHQMQSGKQITITVNLDSTSIVGPAEVRRRSKQTTSEAIDLAGYQQALHSFP